jgi:hypothetical protein
MMSQEYCLRWHNHQPNLMSVLGDVMIEETFTDVTLSVEGQFFNAHKVIKHFFY